MGNIEDYISEAKKPQRTVTLCLRGDLQQAWEELQRQLRAAQDADGGTLSGPDDARELVGRMDTIAEEMRVHERAFRFRGLGHPEYRALIEAHRVPEEDATPGNEGINWDTFPAALIAACCVDPPMTVAQAERLCAAVTDGQWDALFEGARAVNRSLVNVPPTLSGFGATQGTGPNSKPPAPGGSPAANSLAGSPAG
jgi:hypothetical protein